MRLFRENSTEGTTTVSFSGAREVTFLFGRADEAASFHHQHQSCNVYTRRWFVESVTTHRNTDLSSMSHCHDEHEGHGYGHDHSHGAHDHSDDITPALQNHVYQQIDFSAINTLNESSPRAGAKICQKTWDQRMDLEPQLCSDADEQLLMHIP